MSDVQFRWLDQFEVGIAELDADHREMCRQINLICDFALARDHDAAERQLALLIELAASHFEREEVLKHGIGGDTITPLESCTGPRDAVLADLATRLRADGSAFDLSGLSPALIDWFCKQTIGHDAWIRAYFHQTGPTLVPR